MKEEILNDFFKFLSTDKLSISSRDLQNFEIFIAKTDFEDIYENLIEFLNDIIYFSVQKLDLNINLKDEGQINLNANNQLKKYQTSSDKKLYRDRSTPPSTSYKMLYKKNLEFNRIKKTEMKRSYRNLIKNKNIDLKINSEIFGQFFAENSKYCEIILKFMVKMQNIIINSQLLVKQNSENNFYKHGRRSRRKVNKAKIYLNDIDKSLDRSNVNKTEDESYKCLNIKSIKIKNDKFTKSDLSSKNPSDNEWSRSNIVNKTCLSDNEILMKTKLNFLKVLKSVTNNIAKKEGKRVEVGVGMKLEKENLEKPENKREENIDMCNYFDDKNDKNDKNEEKVYQGVITFKESGGLGINPSDIKVTVEEQKTEKIEKNDKNYRLKSQGQDNNNKETEYNIGEPEHRIKSQTKNESFDKKKERKNNSNSACKCNCLIY